MEYAQQPFFNRGPSAFARFLLFALLALTLIVADSRFKYLTYVQQVVAVAIYPLQRLALAPASLLDRMSGFFSTQTQLTTRNNLLEQQNLVNAAALLRLEALELENARLRGLLDTRAGGPQSSVYAEILYSHRDPFTRRVIISKGLTDGIGAGQPVVDAAGLVGQVTRVYPWASQVTLITDKDMTVPVQVMRSGVRGVLFGVGSDGALELRFMPFSADIQNGDKLITSGIDGTYPAGLPVATVLEVERNAAFMFARISAQPTAGVNRYRQVLVLTSATGHPENPGFEEAAPPRKRGRKGG
ncbi:MAG: rod shape-determining protein MreC [Burkholderiales bacterium]|jgi:rod shape-determining protein MreC|nr:rod shape-determining protein MreC [Burkholderiales bacterium]